MNLNKSYTMAAASLTGHASNVTGATWAIATEGAGDGMAHFVTVRNDSATDHSAKTITLTGKDANGNTQTETLAAPGTSATVTSTKPFLSLSAATVSATIGADTFDIGWTAACVSDWVPADYKSKSAPVSVAVIKGGTVNYDVEHTYSPNPSTVSGATAFKHSVVYAKTANADGVYAYPIMGLRLNVNSHTSGTLNLQAIQGERP